MVVPTSTSAASNNDSIPFEGCGNLGRGATNGGGGDDTEDEDVVVAVVVVVVMNGVVDVDVPGDCLLGTM